ncbi:MAG: hypothetical protein QNJ54_27845 [Prochloraceae cyanobacterium]|nr:hypothetical protein [Prochloraceae cyanobacterium]
MCKIFEQIEWENILVALSFLKIKDIDSKSKEIKNQLKQDCHIQNYKLLKSFFLEKYDFTSLIEFVELIIKSEKDNINTSKCLNDSIKAWLNEANLKLKPGDNNEEINHNLYQKDFSLILLVIIKRLADGENKEKWLVSGQYKYQNKYDHIIFSNKKNIMILSKFKDIPRAIQECIDYLTKVEYKKGKYFDTKTLARLRVEMFVSLYELNRNFDALDKIGTTGLREKLIKKYPIFLRCIERIDEPYSKDLLEQGWNKIENFLKSNSSNISIKTFKEVKPFIDNKTINSELLEPLHVIEILEKDDIENWTELIDFMETNSNLWCVKLKGSLKRKKFRINFFDSIVNSGIPIVFWNWDSIPPPEVNLEQELFKYLSQHFLNNRCEELLKKTWRLRRIAWDENLNANKRKKYPGYYLRMLLEDPDIVPINNLLEEIKGIDK